MHATTTEQLATIERQLRKGILTRDEAELEMFLALDFEADGAGIPALDEIVHGDEPIYQLVCDVPGIGNGLVAHSTKVDRLLALAHEHGGVLTYTTHDEIERIEELEAIDAAMLRNAR